MYLCVFISFHSGHQIIKKTKYLQACEYKENYRIDNVTSQTQNDAKSLTYSVYCNESYNLAE